MSKPSELEQQAGAHFTALELSGGASGFFSFGDLIATFRSFDETSLADFAEVLGVEEAYLRDVEAGHEVVSVEEAAAWADAVDYPATEFVRRVLQDHVDRAELRMCVLVENS